MRALAFFVVCVAVSLAAVAGSARAGMLAAPGPSPSWTNMQKFEWNLGFMASAARVCGSHTEADVLHRLARMSPYGIIGLRVVTADGFARPVCGDINNDAKALVADAKRIQEHLETTYDCRDDGCFGQSLNDWEHHACGNSLKSHFAILDIDTNDVREVTMLNPLKIGSKAAHLARVQFHSCQGSLYIELTPQCVMEKKQTRGDCEITGVDGY
jgi:hypothetical protein